MALLTLMAAETRAQQDSVNVIVGRAAADTLQSDSTKIIEDAALDIAQNRGLFIITPDRKLQLRILGSVRYLVAYDNRNMPNKNSFSTTDIPTGEKETRFPSIYNGLDQTRLGFEITRKTNNGNVFVRLETDFVGDQGYRIRHAYGQFNRLLFGQTWSLFSHIVNIPATVDFNAPTGTATTRTPQVRFSLPNFFAGYNLSVAAEYFLPDVNLPDTFAIEPVLLIPDVTARLDRTFDWGRVQLSGLLTFLSGREEGEEPVVLLGWGGAFSAILNSWVNGKWYFQSNMGQGITRYFNDLEGQGFDLLIDPRDGNGRLPFAFGSSITYEHAWSESVFSNFTYGALLLENYAFTPDQTYRWGDSFRVNTFFSVIDGARMGVEWLYGVRNNQGGVDASAIRVNFLVYYDF